MTHDVPGPDDAARQPLVNLPAEVLALAGLLGLAFLSQLALGESALWLALMPRDVWAGHPLSILTGMFLHSGLTHFGLNAIYTVVFATPCIAFMGALRGRGRPWPFLRLMTFFVACGLIGGLGYALSVGPGGPPAIGASGAASGLFGAALRIGRYPDGGLGLRPFRDRTFAGMSVIFLIINIASPFIPTLPGFVSDQIAWQDHLAGFAAGALLIPLWRDRAWPSRRSETAV